MTSPMVAMALPLAQGLPFQQGSPLFRSAIDTTAIVVLALVVGVLLAAGVATLIGFLRQRRLEQLPAVLGDPKALLDNVSSASGLAMPDRRLLTKMAFLLRLPQPVSILLSPALMVQAARAWQESPRFAQSRQWGLSRLDQLARRIHQRSLGQLAKEQTPEAAPQPSGEEKDAMDPQAFKALEE